MTGREFFVEMGRLHEAGDWQGLEGLLKEEHPLLPGEREALLELIGHVRELGHQPHVQLDNTGLHVVKTNT